MQKGSDEDVQKQLSRFFYRSTPPFHHRFIPCWDVDGSSPTYTHGFDETRCLKPSAHQVGMPENTTWLSCMRSTVWSWWLSLCTQFWYWSEVVGRYSCHWQGSILYGIELADGRNIPRHLDHICSCSVPHLSSAVSNNKNVSIVDCLMELPPYNTPKGTCIGRYVL